MDRYEELLSEYLDGSLDVRGRSELGSLVRQEPERLRECLDLVRESRILAAAFPERSQEDFSREVIADLEKDKTRFIRAVMTDVRRGGTRPTPRPRRRSGTVGGNASGWATWAFMAAGATVVLGILAWAGRGESKDRQEPLTRSEKRRPAAPPAGRMGEPAESSVNPEPSPPPQARGPRVAPESPLIQKPQSPSTPVPLDPEPRRPEAQEAALERISGATPSSVLVATLEQVEGNVNLGKASAQAGQPLEAGFDLGTADERSTAALRYPDGTRVELRGPSRLHDVSEGSGRRVYVEGTLESEIPKLPAEQPMIFVTAHAEARIVGTKIRIETDSVSTRLDVTEGRVKFTRLKDKASVEVAAGHFAVAAPNVPLVSRLSRAGTGLVSLYTFKEGRGAVLHDVSRAGAPIDLKIENDKSVRWSPKGLTLTAPTIVASPPGATRIAQACTATNELSIEVWIRSATLTPAAKDGRILSLSSDYQNQNFMLGQDQMEGPSRSYFVRLRSTATDQVGKPALASPEGSVTPRLTQLVYSRAASGAAVLYVDGQEVSRSIVAGSLSAWNGDYRLALGNEFTHDRPWLGEYRLLALYSRALSADEVRQNHRAGTE